MLIWQQRRAVLVSLLLAADVGTGVIASGGPWTHSFASPSAFQFIDFGYSMLNDVDLAFVAQTYAIVSLEKCTGRPQGIKTEDAVYSMAGKLKALNPAIKVLFYLHTDMVSLECYLAHTEYMARPDWHVRTDKGELVNASLNIPVINFSIPAARAWFAAIPLKIGVFAVDLIDGLLADGTGSWTKVVCARGAVSKERCDALIAGKSLAVRAAQDAFDAAKTGGKVIQNGIFMYDGLPTNDRNLFTLPDADGIMGEHFAVFENVIAAASGTPWRYDVPRIASFMDSVAVAAAANKTVVVATWPGPYVQPFSAQGWPSWPMGDQPTSLAGWKVALAEKRAFALAGFLMMVEQNVFMQYQGFYTNTQGAIWCGAETRCAAPEIWYPDAKQPLGAPLGAAVRVNNSWSRSFEHAFAYFNLDIPSASYVTFFSVSLTPSSSPSVSDSPSFRDSSSESASTTVSVTLGGSQSNSQTPLATPTQTPTLTPTSTPTNGLPIPADNAAGVGSKGITVGVAAGMSIGIVALVAAVGATVGMLLRHRWINYHRTRPFMLKRVGGPIVVLNPVATFALKQAVATTAAAANEMAVAARIGQEEGFFHDRRSAVPQIESDGLSVGDTKERSTNLII